ncbi:MAG: AraC family transcriptional regulator ligand-binding domain-containing protein [Pseudomonadota bacterium]|nr:AraC family transcriptional regulator ligand-binding domain-containing protein [Pseudomonadota bacterium]
MERFLDNSRISTVSFSLIEDLLRAIQGIASDEDYQACLKRAGLSTPADARLSRVSRDQIVELYQAASRMTGDEMMGLWSRPIRSGALKQICTSMIGASSLGAAMFRMVTFWNLVLDDYQLHLEAREELVSLAIRPRAGVSDAEVNRFGHMLLLKLTHGLASWLSGQELSLVRVSFVFPRPTFASDYSVLFPVEVDFSKDQSSIAFDRRLWSRSVQRTTADLHAFLTRAPRDWIFTTSQDHNLTRRIRAILQSQSFDVTLDDTANALHLTPRTLIRHLQSQNTSFQAIKDDLRRDVAIAKLREGLAVEVIAEETGFSSASTFHRAFRRWTGDVPSSFRRDISPRVGKSANS